MLIGVPTETPVGNGFAAVAPKTADMHKTPGHTVKVQASAGAFTR